MTDVGPKAGCPIPLVHRQADLGVGDKPAVILFAVILFLAAATRLIGLSSTPPALLPDEATNGYDAYSLLETGMDRWGEGLPVLLEAFGRGDYRPALYAYLAVPFAALLGPERLDLATRLPAALCGVITVSCFYVLIAHVCDRRTALWAALFLALSPWHIRMSRFGHESALTPAFLIVGLLLLSRAGWPLRGPRGGTASDLHLRWPYLALAGGVTALSLYSYGSMRLFVPAMLVACAVTYRDPLRRALRQRKSRRALSSGLLAFTIVAAPMIWLATTEGSKVNGRAQYASLFHRENEPAEALRQAGDQYLAHYGPSWLFTRGDRSALSPTPRAGQLNWCMLPLLPLGLIVMWRQRKDNRVYGLLLAWLLLYPLASALCEDGPHGNRAACGIGVFQWIAAIGAGALTGSWHHRPGLGRLISGILLAAVGVNGVLVMSHYFVTLRKPFMAHVYQTDLRDAVLFLRGRWRDYDRIFISDHVSNERQWGSEHPYIYVLTYMPIPPAEFHRWKKVVDYRRPETGFHYVESAGPFTFSTQPKILAAHFQEHPEQRVLIVGRPGDVTGGGSLLHTIRDADGEPRFELIEVTPP